MDRDDRKRAVAQAALEFVIPGELVGAGTGSTANAFIDALAESRPDRGCGRELGGDGGAARRTRIRIVGLNAAGNLPLYVDGADETTRHRHLVKGGGGALTREKIVAAAAKTFVCVVDDSKLVDRLGRFPLPLEVIPMARSLVAARSCGSAGGPSGGGASSPTTATRSSTCTASTSSTRRRSNPS